MFGRRSRNPSGPAACAAPKGRTHDRTRTGASNPHKPLAPKGPSTHGGPCCAASPSSAFTSASAALSAAARVIRSSGFASSRPPCGGSSRRGSRAMSRVSVETVVSRGSCLLRKSGKLIDGRGLCGSAAAGPRIPSRRGTGSAWDGQARRRTRLMPLSGRTRATPRRSHRARHAGRRGCRVRRCRCRLRRGPGCPPRRR
jgi:hypothetical protein